MESDITKLLRKRIYLSIVFFLLVLGIVVGAIPGLTSDLGIILCIPLTYGMEPVMAILMLQSSLKI